MSMKAVKILDYGDSSNLSYEDAPIPEPGKGEVNKFWEVTLLSLYRDTVRLAEGR